ncbi:MAG: hypothetical protein IKU08_01345 [Clostridia bacterium]|nr:hypothetical protein [Clostridia bacterium]
MVRSIRICPARQIAPPTAKAFSKSITVSVFTAPFFLFIIGKAASDIPGFFEKIAY